MTLLQVILLILAVILYVKLVFLHALYLRGSGMSVFELQRRVKAGEASAIKAERREKLLKETLTARFMLQTIFTVAIALLCVGIFDWWLGSVVAILALLSAGLVASYKRVRAMSWQWYERYEKNVQAVVDHLHPMLQLLGAATVLPQPNDIRVASREELVHVIHESTHVLNKHERTLLAHALAFPDVTVREVMTPRSVVKTINNKEVLGPLTLTELHESGHSRFPVVTKDLDTVIGILYAHDIMNTQRQRKTTAEKAMDARVYYINEQQSLEKALAAFLRVKHHLFIVVNEFEEATGVITIEDVIEKLIGRKIVDEFDQYEDLRAVARLAAAECRKSEASERV